MQRIIRSVVVVALAALPLAAQQSLPELAQAQQVLVLAESAGAQTYAKSLYDEATVKIRYAQDNLSSHNSAIQQQARMNAQEALFAARAALAKARWLSTNAAVINLQSDIRRFGGTSNVHLPMEDPNIAYLRGTTTRERIAAAQAAIDQARGAGAEQAVPDNDLATAAGDLDSARKVSRNGNNDSEIADYLAYVSEMIARRAYYMARFNESSRSVPDLQLQRTRLAQTFSEQQASTERVQREEAERRAAQLQQQLNAQTANSQAQTAELENLRQQVEASRSALLQRVQSDRAARLEAERNLDAAMRAYESAALNSNQADLDRLRRQVEDQEIALRTIQERERLNAQAIGADDAYQRELTADLAARTEIQKHHEAAILAAAQQRQQTETAQYRAEIEAAHQAATLAEERAAQTQQQLTDAQIQAQQQLAAQRQQAQQTEQQLTQQVQQKNAEAEQARQAAQVAQAELAKTREELAQKDAEARQLRMQQELSKIASTRQESRGLVVTLPSGIFFDSGKSTLKPGAKKTLDRIAQQLKTDSSIKVFVEGHTDSTGSAQKNLTLSEKRADAVRDYLAGRGVAEGQISAAGKGEAEPVATNKTVAGRQQNRRVELVITRS